jgi:hypothetical protein
MFPSLIARAATTDIISSGMGGTKSGALQMVCRYPTCSIVFCSEAGVYECFSFPDTRRVSIDFAFCPCASSEVPSVMQATHGGCVGCS